MNSRTMSAFFCAISALGFQATVDSAYTQDSTPKGWLHRGDHPESYEMMADTSVKHSGTASARIRFIGQQALGFGTLMQMLTADDFRGKRLRMSAWMRTEKADAAQLWMRMDGPSSTLAFDNMQNRRVIGTTDWKRYEIILDVPSKTLKIGFGALVVGKGQAWVDDFVVEIVGKDVRTTAKAVEFGGVPVYTVAEFPRQPRNLSFEE